MATAITLPATTKTLKSSPLINCSTTISLSYFSAVLIASATSSAVFRFIPMPTPLLPFAGFTTTAPPMFFSAVSALSGEATIVCFGTGIPICINILEVRLLLNAIHEPVSEPSLLQFSRTIFWYFPCPKMTYLSRLSKRRQGMFLSSAFFNIGRTVCPRLLPS